MSKTSEDGFERAVVGRILQRLSSPPALLQILVGPRQVGKTTAAHSVIRRWQGPSRYAEADLPLPPGPEWIHTHWTAARGLSEAGKALLVLDEVQKVAGWGEAVKALWDADRASGSGPFVLLLGSSSLLLSRGTSESLAGRFFLHRCPHWSFDECRRAFGWNLDGWLFFGGYPGPVPLIEEQPAWRAHVTDALVETVLARDVLAMHTVGKPALLRNLFLLSARFPAQILSYNKMLGQLLDAGNTTTLAHYLKLLETAYLISGLERYSPGGARSRSSSPKLVLWNNALVTALQTRSLEQCRADPAFWGRLVENAVGAHLLCHLQGLPYEVMYWREKNDEVDYVVRAGDETWALEVKSGRPGRRAGAAAFLRRCPGARVLLVGEGGLELEEFFSQDPQRLFAA